MQHFRGVHNTFGCVGWLGRMAAVLGTFRGVHSTFSWRYPGAPGASTQRAHAGLRVGPGAHGGSAPRGDSLACAGKGLRWAGKCCIRFPLACAAKGLRWIGKCCINTGDCNKNSGHDDSSYHLHHHPNHTNDTHNYNDHSCNYQQRGFVLTFGGVSSHL